MLILASVSSYSQRIRTIGTDTFVAFTREQAKAVNDTFIVQKQTIYKLKQQDSLYIDSLKRIATNDSIRRSKDSITYYQQLIPLINELKGLLVSQIETPFKHNFEVGVGAGLSTYFGTYRPIKLISDGKYYMPLGMGVLKYNYHKHLTARFEIFGTQVSAATLNETIAAGTLLADYNLAPNMYSIRVGMIPVISIGYNIFGLTNESPVIGGGIKSYFTSNTALEINVRFSLTDIDKIDDSDKFIWGNLSITRKLW